MGPELAEYFAHFSTRVSGRATQTIQPPPVIGWRIDPLEQDQLVSHLLRRRYRGTVLVHKPKAQSTTEPQGPSLKQQIDAAMRREFVGLAKRWQKAHQFSSSISDVALHPAYQRIIGFGPPVLPLILRDLEKSLNHWFWALNAITGENPVPEEQYGDMEAMRARWLEWGRARGIIA